MIKKLEKADGQSMDIVENNIEQLKELFPEVFTEGKVNFDRLQEVLGNYVVTDEDHYNFTWHGKRAAGRLAQTPSTGTLRPCPQESVDWDKTQNLFIEGDNLEVLKLLQKSYHRQIKMIYIDPPYNTGNDFVYEDDFKDGVKNYLAVTGQLDDEGKKKGTNSSAAGRYHTNWLNMMYPRLKLARNLLRDDGVIFISIDDNEFHNLRKICDDIFGEECFVATFKWNRTAKAPSLSDSVRKKYEYVLCYKKFNLLKLYGKESYNTQAPLLHLPNKQAEIIFPARSIKVPNEFEPGNYSEKYQVVLLDKINLTSDGFNGNEIRLKGCFAWSQNKINQYVQEGNHFLVKKSLSTIYYYLQPDGGYIAPSDLISDEECGVKRNTDAKEEMRKLGIDFDYSKPVSLIKYLIGMVCKKDEAEKNIILDFFAGSSTTAQAVMDMNAQDAQSLRYILIQLPEQIERTSDAFGQIYNNIADIGKERIRRAAKKIKEENPLFSGDLGFKVFKLDTSNIKTWEAGFDTLKDDLIAAADYIKQDRSSDDIVFELLLKYGLDLTVPIETRMIAGKKVYSIGMGALVVCLDNDVPMETVNGIGALKKELRPEIMRVVFKDSGFKDDVVKTNALQTLKRFGIEDIKSL